MNNKLKPEQLRKTYQPQDVSDIPAMQLGQEIAIIGQDRAVKALKFGLGNRAPGFNVYVSAPHGEEKISVIQHFLRDLAEQDPLPFDWCYVNNFTDSYCPIVLRLPQGRAIEFKADIANFVRGAREALIKALESEEYAQKQNEIKQDITQKTQGIYNEVQEEAQKAKFLVKTSPLEIIAIPLVDGKPMSQEQFQGLTKDERKEIQAQQVAFQKLLDKTMRRIKDVEKIAAEQLLELEKKAAMFSIQDLLQDLLNSYGNIDGVTEFIKGLQTHMLDHLASFLQEQNSKKSKNLVPQRQESDYLYQVNVLVDNGGLSHSPIIVELNPTYNNLFGKIERESVMGTWVTDFTLIRSGALHRANGGYLILPVEDLLSMPYSYDQLKRSLRNKRIEIEDPTERFGFISAKSLKPQPVPLDLQVILIGRNYLMQLLYRYDDDFRDLFKVKAEFDSVMPAHEKNIKELCGYVHSFCAEEGLLPASDKGLTKILEYGHRLANHQEKLSTKLEEIADIIREANYYANEDDAQQIGSDYIEKAISEKHYRSNLLQEKIREMIEARTIVIDVHGSQVGQINGLSVLDVGDLTFGRPSRITATTHVGSSGIIDIEREVEMGGPIHSKGVLILSGYLHEKFGRDKPLNLSAQVVFEQSYSGVEGDSASSAELYAILSSLADVPLAQNIAVTGSVNQKGEIQAVGGINEKVEGYFAVCNAIGLDGSQGVLIPRTNMDHLLLKEDVVQAVEQGQFHLWAVASIEEGIEILTGQSSGKVHWNAEQRKLEFEKDTLFDQINQRLVEMSAILKEYGPAGGDNK